MLISFWVWNLHPKSPNGMPKHHLEGQIPMPEVGQSRGHSPGLGIDVPFCWFGTHITFNNSHICWRWSISPINRRVMWNMRTSIPTPQFNNHIWPWISPQIVSIAKSHGESIWPSPSFGRNPQFKAFRNLGGTPKYRWLVSFMGTSHNFRNEWRLG